MLCKTKSTEQISPSNEHPQFQQVASIRIHPIGDSIAEVKSA